jgi:hypothetical protein
VVALWQGLSSAHRRWLLINAVIVATLANAVLTGGAAWLMSRGHSTVGLLSLPLIGKPSSLVDTLGTLFALPLITTLAVTRSVRREQRRGSLAELAPGYLPGRLGRLPVTALQRGLLLGAMCIAVLGPVASALLVGLASAGMSQPDFVLYKACLGASLGVVVTPLIAVFAMADPVPA